ncbi:transglutaminase domain-containing protein [Cutibacterium sp. WCA-380-WT-3A]|uniref:Transglutaminase domain-containing protein n=1 Tax=Cutibacterium porci TaxID=2605781 RepID=A0A7K0J7A3_9ACTN|nr:DUF3488 and transglutaminase-like domain-containing protein [Cutibacterium porci]MSS45840.1 transglutaminase domain-containing protein [Cutibacterium porci]
MTRPHRATQSPSQQPGSLDVAKDSSAHVTIHIAVALAMILAVFSIARLTTDPFYWIGPAAIAVFLETIGLVCRRHHWDHAEVQGIQAILVVIVAAAAGGVSASGSPGMFPINVLHLYRDTITVIQTTTGPLPPSIGVIWLATTVVGILTVLTDLLTITLERPGWSLAPLLAIHLVAVLAATDGTPWWSFALIAAGWLIILTVDHALSGGGPLAWLTAAILTVIVIALATILATIAPVWGHIDLSRPGANPSAPVRMSDPTIDLRRNLHNTSTASIISYTTNAPDGEYLRTTSLPKMTDRGWGLIPVDLQRTAPGTVPGLSGPSRSHTVDVSITKFSSQYLPAPYGPIAADVDQTWAWDPQSLTIVSTSADHNRATTDMQYTISVQAPDPDPATFDNAIVGTPDNAVYTEAPATIPSDIRELTHRITEGKSAPVAKAIAIQNWLRDSARFRYDINAPEGDGYQVLENFLLRTRRGYCIHFAASMALMARLEGIPSRVSVGFLPGTRDGNTWKVSARQMHAWPELYFQDYGWVRFEPTAAVAPAPAWTTKGTATHSTSPTPESSPTSSAPTPASASPEPSRAQTPTPTTRPVPIDNASHDNSIWAPLVAVLAILVVLTLPMLIRILIARRRMTSGSIAGMWREVHDLWIDHGLAWPDGTPRHLADALATDMDPTTAAAITKLALGEERDRWSGRDGSYDTMIDDLHTVREWLAHAHTPRPHWLARWMPTSLIKR